MGGRMTEIAVLFSWLDKTVLSFLVSGVFSVAAFVLEAVSLYAIAKRRGLRKAYFAWIPFLQLWALGNISDHFQHTVKDKKRAKRWTLLIVCVLASLAGTLMSGMAKDLIREFIQSGTLHMPQLSWILSVGAVALLGAVLSVTQTVLRFFALYDLFCSCEPKNAVLYLVISIFFGAALPIFLFICRKKDLGMPARQPA